MLCLQRVANDAWPLIADQLRRRGYEGQLLMDQRDIRYTAKHTMPSRRFMRMLRSFAAWMETMALSVDSFPQNTDLLMLVCLWQCVVAGCGHVLGGVGVGL